MQFFIENLLHSTPVELTASIITWFIIFVVVGTTVRIVANYYSQGKFQRSKRSVLKEETTKLSGATLFMALFTGISGMGTMFAVNELIKTNKMVAESTEAAIKASESAAKQTEQVVLSNLLSVSQKQAEFLPLVNFFWEADFVAESIIESNGKNKIENACYASFKFEKHSEKPTYIKELFFQVGPFFISDFTHLYELPYLLEKVNKGVFDVKINDPQHSGFLQSEASDFLKLRILLNGINKDKCVNYVKTRATLGSGFVAEVTTGVSSRFVSDFTLLNYEIVLGPNNKKELKKEPTYSMLKDMLGTKLTSDAVGYIVSRKSPNSNFNKEMLNDVLKELTTLHHSVSFAIHFRKCKSKPCDLNSKLYRIFDESNFEFCKNKKDNCLESVMIKYATLVKSLLKFFQNSQSYKVEKLSDVINRVNTDPICEQMGHGPGCEDLIKKSKIRTTP